MKRHAICTALAIAAAAVLVTGLTVPDAAARAAENCFKQTVATLPGTIGDDVLVGTPGDDVIFGFGGDDTIRGLGGQDVICAGDGDDVGLRRPR